MSEKAEIASRRKRNGAITGLENAYSIFAKTPAMGAVAIGAIALGGAALDGALSALGVNTQGIIPTTIEAIKEGGIVPFGIGVTAGVAKNAVLIKKTLDQLKDGKTGPGTSFPMATDLDGTKVFHITCVDARREDNSGGALPGSFAVLGAEIRSIIEAGFNAKLLSPLSPILGDFAAGYYFGSNIITGIQAHYQLAHEIRKCMVQARAEDPNARIKIQMEDHWDGCGAQGFTSIPSYVAKFKWHNKPLADFIGLPNEVLGYVWANSVLPLIVGTLTKGQVSFGATTAHSPMKG